MSLQIQELLRSGKSIADLAEVYDLKVDETDDLVLLNYGIKTPRNLALSRECRGLILEKGSWNLVALPFFRFFNADEFYAADIDWETAFANEKLDGSLVTVFNYKDKWRIATRGKIDAVGQLPCPTGKYNTFADLIEELIAGKIFKSSESSFRDLYYVFELVSPLNRIVTRYDTPQLYLLTVKSGLEELPDEVIDSLAKELGFPRPKRYSCSSLKQVNQIMQDLRPDEEGFVVADAKRNRIKVKKLSYVTMHKMAGNGNPDFVELIVTGEDEEFVSYFPEYKDAINDLKETLDTILHETESLWHLAKDIEEQKQFALSIKESPCAWLLFMMRKSGYAGNVFYFWETIDVDKRVKFVKTLINSK